MTARDDIPASILGPDGHERRVRIGAECGEVFAQDEDFDGLTLTIEIASIEEGVALANTINWWRQYLGTSRRRRKEGLG